MSSQPDTTSSYVELSNQAYGLMIDAFTSANRRAFDYTKSVFDIVSRPYATGSAPDAFVRDGLDRAQAIVALTAKELEANASKNVEISQKLAAQASKLQETMTATVRGLVQTGISNMNYVKETSDAQFDGIARQVEEIQARATAVAGTN